MVLYVMSLSTGTKVPGNMRLEELKVAMACAMSAFHEFFQSHNYSIALTTMALVKNVIVVVPCIIIVV